MSAFLAVAKAAVCGVFAGMQNQTEPRRLRSARIRIVLAVLLIVGGLGALLIQLWWAWGWTDTTTWGAWGKPQTHEQHVEQFASYLGKFYWPPVLGSVAAITAGVLLCVWPRGNKAVVAGGD